MTRNGASKQEYSQFREHLEALSEKLRSLRNHFYNHPFNNGTLVKVADVRKIADEMYRLAEHPRRRTKTSRTISSAN